MIQAFHRALLAIVSFFLALISAQAPAFAGNIVMDSPSAPLKEAEDTSKKKVLRELTEEDVAAWRRIEGAQLSPDGEWFVYKV